MLLSLFPKGDEAISCFRADCKILIINKNFIFNWHLFHHNPIISKQPFYMLLEFYGNFMIGGGIIFILSNLLLF